LIIIGHVVSFVESVEWTQDNSTQHMFNQHGDPWKHEIPACTAKNLHDKYIYGHNCTPPFLVQLSELINKDKGNCTSASIVPSLSLDLMVNLTTT